MTSVSLAASFLALAISALTAWLTLLRRGRVRMTQPTQIYFGPDGPRDEAKTHNKVYLRTLLYSTAKRGQLIEAMWLRLRRTETTQNLNVWVYGEKRPLSRGSGLFVGESGVTANHHFLAPFDGAPFEFAEGVYSLEVFATVVGRRQPTSLFATQLTVSSEQAVALRDPANGLYFEWGPDSKAYHPFIEDFRRRQRMPEWADLFTPWIGGRSLHAPNGAQDASDRLR